MSSYSNDVEALVKKKRIHESHKINDIKMLNKEIEDKQMELEKMKNTKKKIETEIGRLKAKKYAMEKFNTNAWYSSDHFGGLLISFVIPAFPFFHNL